MAVASFDDFLALNYPKETPFEIKVKAFLEDCMALYSTDPNWNVDNANPAEIIEAFESSGLRQEIWVYPYEVYHPKHFLNTTLQDTTRSSEEKIEVEIFDEYIPIRQRNSENYESTQFDSILEFNQIGLFIYGLEKAAPTDSLIQEYIHAKQSVGNISPSLVAQGFLNYKEDFNHPLFKRMVVAEFYYFILNGSLEKKDSK